MTAGSAYTDRRGTVLLLSQGKNLEAQLALMVVGFALAGTWSYIVTRKLRFTVVDREIYRCRQRANIYMLLLLKSCWN